MSVERAEVRIKATEVHHGIVMRLCPKCGVLKPLDDFGLRTLKGEGREGRDLITNQSHCRVCR